MKTFASNNQKAKTVNLLYRMTNALMGTGAYGAYILPSVLSFNHYELHKFEIDITTIFGNLSTLFENLKVGLCQHGFDINDEYLENNKGVRVTITLRTLANGTQVLTCRVN